MAGRKQGKARSVGKKQTPGAFLSYVHSDNMYDRVTELRQRLGEEVAAHIGEEFPIFQDRNDILWGQNWKERIEDSIDGSTFFIPIITPSFFNSPSCRDELECFLKREKKLKRNDLILPIYYVDCPLLNEEGKRKSDKLAEAVAERQYADWRELRTEPLTSPEVWRRLEGMAKQVRDALERGVPRKRAPARAVRTRRRKAVGPAVRAVFATDAIELRDMVAAAPGPQPKTEAPTLVVDPTGRGDHVTITEAIEAASAGSRILVRPGVYKEGLVIEKPLEVIGDGALGTAVVEAEGKNAVLFRASMGRVANLVLRQKAGDRCFGVQIAQGRLELEGCDITSEGTACVAIHHGADPVLRRNRIHDGKSGGVFIFLNAQGTLEDNDILGNALSGVTVWSGGNPTLRRNRVNRNEAWGVRVTDTGGGVFEDNDLRDNALGPWSISGDSEAHVRRARNLE